MEESERIQKIMEAEGATEPEAGVLYHLGQATEYWLQIVEGEIKDDAQSDERISTAAGIGQVVNHYAQIVAPYQTHHRALTDLIYARIHHREHSVAE